MVKIERTDTEKSRRAISSLDKEKSKAADKFNTLEVVDALEETFHGKCYICAPLRGRLNIFSRIMETQI